jgi:hypothetical protein
LGKHAPARYETYFKAHANNMAQLKREGFVLDDNLTVTPIRGTPFLQLTGIIICAGNLKMTVYKRLRAQKIAGVVHVHTVTYAYNLSLIGAGNIFRYDNMHSHYGHLTKHHRHQYEPPNVRKRLEHIGEDGWPTLGDALREARHYVDWHRKYKSADRKDEATEMPTESEDY